MAKGQHTGVTDEVRAVFEGRRLRTNERQRQYRAERALQRQAAATQSKRDRLGMHAANVPAPPFGRQQPCAGQVETVEQFRARGGKVEFLTAHWDQVA